jgi:HlyD family secretion protein
MKRLMKLVKFIIVLGVFALLLVMAFWPRSTAVDLATVGRGDLTVTVDEEGKTRVRERFVVSAPVSGRVQRIELEPGDKVTKDQTVVASFTPADPVLLDVRSKS